MQVHNYNYSLYPDIYHHGIKGQKWGVRRFQKKDGSLTNAGKQRYSDETYFKNQTNASNSKPKQTASRVFKKK